MFDKKSPVIDMLTDNMSDLFLPVPKLFLVIPWFETLLQLHCCTYVLLHSVGRCFGTHRQFVGRCGRLCLNLG